MKPRAGSLPPIAANPRWQGCRCELCGREYGPEYGGFVCADCGIDGILDAVYDHASIASAYGLRELGGIWRHADLLPVVPGGDHPGLLTTRTAPLPAGRLARHLGLGDLELRDETLHPSGSLKDRAAVVAVARAAQLGLDHIACASTGNAAASLAVMAARAGLRSTIFVPAAAPRAKLAQLMVHGVDLVRVDGSYDQAFEYSLRRIEQHGWYSRNCAHNPLLVEGKKTAALDLVHDRLAAGAPQPTAVFVPVGDGCIVSSVAKAFAEMARLGVIAESPRIFGVQAAGAAPLADAWQGYRGDPRALGPTEVRALIRPIEAATFADSIRVGIPRNRLKAWRYVAASGGDFLAVPDEAIASAIGLLAARAGVFAEPSGAAGLAGVVAARDLGLIDGRDRIAVLVTGNGLKDVEGGLAGLRIPDPVPPGN